MSTIENRFNEEMNNIYHIAKKELNYTASRFIQLVAKYGGVKAAKKLISKSGGTYGFEVLWENKRLDLSVEALVLRPEYHELFTDEEREICRNRLREFGYESNH
ncbi:MAG: hypothetical protein K0S01_2764 [Herbinix sp.]|jgi:hypothetical protein|nr:hypothetical protein [Herbinix sp.]